MKKLLLFLAVITLTFQSCSNSDDNEEAVITSSFTGNWTGTYTGTGDNGTWDIDVAANGTVTGTATSNVFIENYNVNGTVDTSGLLTSTFGSTSAGGTFNGQMTGNAASGTWVNPSAGSSGMNGNWSGNKN